jgi:hypothetical protein
VGTSTSGHGNRYLAAVLGEFVIAFDITFDGRLGVGRK